MKIKNPNFKKTERANKKSALSTYLNGLGEDAETLTFADVRANVEGFAGAGNGEIHQALNDGGFEVDHGE